MQKCWIHMLKHVGYESYVYSVVAIFINSADALAELKGSHFHVVVIGIVAVVVSILYY